MKFSIPNLEVGILVSIVILSRAKQPNLLFLISDDLNGRPVTPGQNIDDSFSIATVEV